MGKNTFLPSFFTFFSHIFLLTRIFQGTRKFTKLCFLFLCSRYLYIFFILSGRRGRNKAYYSIFPGKMSFGGRLEKVAISTNISHCIQKPMKPIFVIIRRQSSFHIFKAPSRVKNFIIISQRIVILSRNRSSLSSENLCLIFVLFFSSQNTHRKPDFRIKTHVGQKLWCDDADRTNKETLVYNRQLESAS